MIKGFVHKAFHYLLNNHQLFALLLFSASISYIFLFFEGTSGQVLGVSNVELSRNPSIAETTITRILGIFFK